MTLPDPNAAGPEQESTFARAHRMLYEADRYGNARDAISRAKLAHLERRVEDGGRRLDIHSEARQRHEQDIHDLRARIVGLSALACVALLLALVALVVATA